jgi:hypothetical protein
LKRRHARIVLEAERVSRHAFQFTGRRAEIAADAERARAAGHTLNSHPAISTTFPEFAKPSAEFIEHCPEASTT